MKKLVLLLSVVLMGCGKHGKLIKNQNIGNALGTTYSIIYISDGSQDFQKEIDSVFYAVNQSMSTYIPNSDISRINEGDTSVVVDHMFNEVFALSRKVHRTSNGYFDPTVGALVNAWGFGPGKQIALDSSKVDSILQYVGFEKVNLAPNGTIQKSLPGIYFDFNAIAKGYAIDRLGAMLNDKGIKNYLVEVGGEVLTRGKNNLSNKEWTVGIDDPQVEFGRQLKKIVSLSDRALASSGNYRKFRIDSLTGERYVHTIDPKTGFTKNSKVLAASVIAENCATADAYATAFMAMDLEDGKKLIEELDGLEVYIIYLDNSGDTQEFMSPGFQKLVGS
ncbi:MAG: FAD:protein FMN transferase [Bacteroidota bacterium]